MTLAINIQLPEWLASTAAENESRLFTSTEEKMRFTIGLANQSVTERTGGPFGATVFDEETNTLISVGVNAVVTQGLSIAHAETLAIALAQKKVGSFDLAQDLQKRYSLYTSGQPCIMCFGVIWWSGITKLVSAATAEDIEQITGFREGPLPQNWAEMLENRDGLPNLTVLRETLREEACEVLRMYAASGQPVYNAGSTRPGTKKS